MSFGIEGLSKSSFKKKTGSRFLVSRDGAVEILVWLEEDFQTSSWIL
jgi:hypothetical protein